MGEGWILVVLLRAMFGGVKEAEGEQEELEQTSREGGERNRGESSSARWSGERFMALFLLFLLRHDCGIFVSEGGGVGKTC